jgi:hypothetical protein
MPPSFISLYYLSIPNLHKKERTMRHSPIIQATKYTVNPGDLVIVTNRDIIGNGKAARVKEVRGTYVHTIQEDSVEEIQKYSILNYPDIDFPINLASEEQLRSAISAALNVLHARGQTPSERIKMAIETLKGRWIAESPDTGTE